jgi:Family of unknown function (DUF6599)
MAMRRGIPMRALLFGIFLTFAVVLPAGAQLPDSFHGWKSQSVQTISLPELDSVAGDNADVIREYGFLGAERREYSQQDGTLSATLWLMQDATGGYGLFTFLGETGMTRARNGDDSEAFSPGVFLFQRGSYVLEVRSPKVAPLEVEALAATIPESKGRESLLPPLPRYLPREGLVPQSEKYMIGPLAFSRVIDRIPATAIRFDMGAEAASAQYQLEQGTISLLLLSYPTPQVASKILQQLETLPGFTKSGQGKNLFIERKGSLVAFVMDAPSLAATQALLSRVAYEASLTWDEYVPPPGENTGSMMLAVFSLAGFILLIALFSGLAFGAIRLVAKRFISKPIFDRPTTQEIIRLNLDNLQDI